MKVGLRDHLAVCLYKPLPLLGNGSGPRKLLSKHVLAATNTYEIIE
jgi:hypothetical protein